MIQQNLVPETPELKDLLNLFGEQLLVGLNCHHIGTVQSFNPVTQTATATINYKKTFFEVDPVSGNYEPKLMDYPVLLDCPCIVLGGGAGALTFPITPGDSCVILFNDRDIDNWFSGGGTGSPVATPRLHSFSDGLILVGVRSMANALTAYDSSRSVLRQGQALVGVGGAGGTKVKIANTATTLNTLLQQLCTQLESLITQIAAITVTGVTSGSSASGTPANATMITAISAQISATATSLGGLLE